MAGIPHFDSRQGKTPSPPHPDQLWGPLNFLIQWVQVAPSRAGEGRMLCCEEQHNITQHGMLPQYPTTTTKLIYDWF